MGFDAPGSNNNPLVWVLFIAVTAAPYIMFGCLIGAWILHWKRQPQVAVIVSTVPMLLMLVVLAGR
jgi:uncharacterized membrane protein YfcA